MRAGKLDRTISIETYSAGEPDDYGNVTAQWVPLATLRAQLIQSSTEEFIRAYGASDETVIIFRTRWLSGVSNSARISYEGGVFNVKEVKEIGRRIGLELRAVRNA
jgi:SPP1 family predicted phage head-tail adaptor